MRESRIKSRESRVKSQACSLELIAFSLLLAAYCLLLSPVTAYAADKCFVCDKGNWRLASGSGDCPSNKDLPKCTKDDQKTFDLCQASADISSQTCDSNYNKPVSNLQGPKQETTNEKALQVQNNLLLPKEIANDIKPVDSQQFTKLSDPGGVLSRLKLSLQSFISSLFGFQPANKEEFTSRSDTQKQQELPAELGGQSSDPVNKTFDNLGNDTGLYSLNCPDEIKKQLKDSKGKLVDYEKQCAEQSFPAGINPISGQDSGQL